MNVCYINAHKITLEMSFILNMGQAGTSISCFCRLVSTVPIG